MKTILALYLLALTSTLTLAEEGPKPFQVVPPGTAVKMTSNITFATNRSVLPLGKQTEETATFFMASRTSTLKYGSTVFVLHGDKHELSKLDDTIEFKTRSRMTEKQFLTPPLNAGKEHLLVFIHGYNNSLESALKQSVLLKQDLKTSQSFIVYSWASAGSPVSYHPDRWDLKDNAKPLAEFIQKLTDSRAAESVDFIVHSMGNDVFLTAIDQLEKNGLLKKIQLGKVILTAPDVSQEHFKKSVPLLIKSSQKVTHYFSDKDKAMYLSRYANPIDGKRAGAMLVEVKGLESINVDEVNDSKDRAGHSYFASSPALLKDIKSLLEDETNKKSPKDRAGDKVEEKISESGFRSWKFTK
jgi:esterase/lipase superfamily enzyme